MKHRSLWFGLLAGLLLIAGTSRAEAAGPRLFAQRELGFSQIQELDPVTGAVLNTIPTPVSVGAASPVGLAFDGASLWFISGSNGNQLFELDPDTGAVLDTDPLPAFSSGSSDGLAVVNGKVYIMDYPEDKIYLFDPTTDTVTATLTIAAQVIGGLAGASDALYATVNATTVIEIDPANGVILSTFESGVPDVFGVAVLNNEVYLGRRSGNILVFDRDGTFIRTIISVGVTALGGDDYSDSDRDGVPDGLDECPDSDLRAKVDTGSGPTSVDNIVGDDGCTIQDLVNHAAEDARNHGAYVSAIARLAARLKAAGIITGRQQGQLVSGAARSSVGK